MKTSTLFIVSVLFLILGSCKDENIVQETYPNGTIKMIAEVKDGMRNGLTKNFDENGRLVSTAELKNDIHEGWMINYNPVNHKITAKAFFKNNKQNGPVTLYYTDGQLYRESYYKDGLVDSIVKTYWPGGKLQAENYFRLGEASVGLKEYDKMGNLIKQPQIIIREINQAALLNTVKLAISLSQGSKKADFYSGELKDGKYFDADLQKMYNNNGVVTQQYYVAKRTSLIKKVSVVTKSRTELGNTLILHKYYNLAVSN